MDPDSMPMKKASLNKCLDLKRRKKWYKLCMQEIDQSISQLDLS